MDGLTKSISKCELERKEIAIGIHCDAGRILTKTGSRAQIGICVFFLRKQIKEQTKMKNFSMELRFHE